MDRKWQAPRIPGHLPTLSGGIGEIESKGEYASFRLEACTLAGLDAARASFDTIVWSQVDIIESALPEAELTDVQFEKCDLSNLRLEGAVIHRATFRQCKLIGTDFTGNRIRHARFIDCQSDYASFRLSKLKYAAFESCSLEHADFAYSTLEHTTFTACRLDQAHFSGTKLQGIDLSDSVFTGLHVDIGDLAGCIISPSQAASFVPLMGIVIKP